MLLFITMSNTFKEIVMLECYLIGVEAGRVLLSLRFRRKAELSWGISVLDETLERALGERRLKASRPVTTPS